MRSTVLGTLCVALCARANPISSHQNKAPTAHVKNGTYVGLHSTEYAQDWFLGMPFAQPPVGNLRFRRPQPLTEPWYGKRNAKTYSPHCVGYGSSQAPYNVSEDCLYLNVIRPAGYEDEELPVLVWIFGGAFTQGGAPDRRYNLSFIVEHSVETGQPIIGVSINYRLSAWGFLSSEDVKASGQTNLGIRDQRLALHWVQENIGAFGGDSEKVTIWGQSAGAMSVGQHILAYNGREDRLFRSAIMESGSPLFSSSMNKSYEAQYENLTKAVECSEATDRLQCLREVSFEDLNGVINTTELSGGWFPQIDGDLVATHSSIQLDQGNFVKVPIIIGATSDEGSDYGPKGLNTTEEWLEALENSGIPRDFAEKIIEEYPDNPSEQALQNLPPDYIPGPPYGPLYRRAATYAGDATFIGPRRYGSTIWATAGLPAWSFRFNVIPAGYPQEQAVAHFSEVSFAMMNLEGVGYEPARRPPFQGKPESYKMVARLISGDFISFAVHGDPNAWSRNLAGEIPHWPEYTLNSQQNLVYDANVTSYVEDDTWRQAGIDLINSANLAVYDR